MQPIGAAIRSALGRFSERYQAASDEPVPLFKRRLLGEGVR